MTEAKPAIRSLEQFQMLLYATKDTELTACDLAVLAELTDRYLKDGPRGGTTRPTSAAHLARETGRDDASTQRSLARLVERGYIKVAEPGFGRRGHTYFLPFGWVRETAEAIYKYVKGMADAKKRRRRARRSNRADAVSKALPVATAPMRYLRSFVTAPMRYLDSVATASVRDQSYGYPTGKPVGADVSACALRAQPPIVTKKIIAASVESEDRERWLSVDFDDGGFDIIALESSDADTQQEGQERFARLTSSASLMGDIDGAAELIGCTVHMRGDAYLLPHDVDTQAA